MSKRHEGYQPIETGPRGDPPRGGTAVVAPEQFGEVPTLRDQFAMAALVMFSDAYTQQAAAKQAAMNDMEVADVVAIAVYEQADAMLRAREAKP